MSLDDEMANAELANIWGQLMSPDQIAAMINAKPNPHKRPRAGPQGKQRAPLPELLSWMKALTKLVVRHEDTLNVITSDFQFLAFLGQQRDGIIPLMVEESKKWHAAPEKSNPLRQHLLMLAMGQLTIRLKALAEADTNSPLFQECFKHHLTGQDKRMPYLTWDPEAKLLVPTKTQPVAISMVIRDMEQIKTILQENLVVLRFHSLKRLTSRRTTEQCPGY